MKKVECILLVDDNPYDNHLHQIKIKKANICDNVRVTTTATEALNYLVHVRDSQDPSATVIPDIIFLDINMPGMDGFEFLEEYEKIDPGLKSKVIIVMLSTSLNPNDSTRALATNVVSEFVNKPLTIEALQNIVERYF